MPRAAAAAGSRSSPLGGAPSADRPQAEVGDDRGAAQAPLEEREVAAADAGGLAGGVDPRRRGTAVGVRRDHERAVAPERVRATGPERELDLRGEPVADRQQVALHRAFAAGGDRPVRPDARDRDRLQAVATVRGDDRPARAVRDATAAQPPRIAGNLGQLRRTAGQRSET